MTVAIAAAGRATLKRRLLFWVAAAFLALPALAQDEATFDPFVADTQLTELRNQLQTEAPEPDFLATLRTRAGQIAGDAAACARRWADESGRLESRLTRLNDAFTSDIPPAYLDQITDVETELRSADAQRAACADIEDSGSALIAQITELQDRLAEQFLSFRGDSVITALRNFPERARAWPSELRSANELSLIDDLTPIKLLWYLVASGIVAAGIGIALRRRFQNWFAANGGPNSEPRMRYLFPKPLAEYSPSLLSGLAFVVVLAICIEGPSLNLVVMRIALGVFLFGLGCVIINWSTGPLSPSASVKGLIPHHVAPLRFRLRILLFALIASFVVLGTNWLTIRMIGSEVTGRAAMIFFVAAALLYAILYLGRVPGLRRRFRLVRVAAVVGLLIGMFAVLLGYQNFAGYVVHGITRSALALFLLWIFIWLVSMAFEYLISEETSAAASVRRTLGTTRDGSRSGLGFMQLIADLVLWLSLVVYLIYVWTNPAPRSTDSTNSWCAAERSATSPWCRRRSSAAFLFSPRC